LFEALLDRIDFNRAAHIILEKGYFDEFLTLDKLCLIKRKHREREQLI